MKKILVKTNDEDVRKEAKLFQLEIVSKPEPLVSIETKADEDKAVKLASSSKRIFVNCKDWKIIPLENLIAKCKGKTELIALVRDAKEAKLALQTMEMGADGVLLETDDSKELQKCLELTKQKSDKLDLEEAEVIAIIPLGTGARSCVDTCTMMKEGQGMLIGSSASGMLLVQAEVMKNELAAPRPFRVNAGGVSMYSLAPNEKTAYIEEVKTGKEVMLVSRNGDTEIAVVGRNKIEVRPLILVKAKNQAGYEANLILQNAETIRLVTKSGSKAVTELKVGDKILGRFQQGGRHFGTLVKDETIIEQ
ncbi:MAG: 3-dehydroquinate synthase II [Candidatus Micrarchaeota archaeon]